MALSQVKCVLLSLYVKPTDSFIRLIYCVQWSPYGDMIATASYDQYARVIDFKTGKVIYSGTTPDAGKSFTAFHHLS